MNHINNILPNQISAPFAENDTQRRIYLELVIKHIYLIGVNNTSKSQKRMFESASEALGFSRSYETSFAIKEASKI
jgi:hypothetical protein